MSDLQKLPPTLDSREVAEMVGKSHAHLCRDIAGYEAIFSTNPKLVSLSFFIERDYKDQKGEDGRIVAIKMKGKRA